MRGCYAGPAADRKIVLLNAHLSKPVQPEALFDTMEKLIAG